MILGCKLKFFIFIFSAPFGQKMKISVPIIKTISNIFMNNPDFWSLGHGEGIYSQSKIHF